MTLNLRHGELSGKRKELEEYSDRLFDRSYVPFGTLFCEAYTSEEPLKFENRFSGDYKVIKLGDRICEKVFDCAWLHITGALPENAETDNTVILLETGGEGLVCDSNGVPQQGITCYAAGFDDSLGTAIKRVVQLNDSIIKDGFVDIWVDYGANNLFGELRKEPILSECFFAKRFPNIRALAFDLMVLLGVWDETDDKAFAEEIKAELGKIDAFADPTDEEAAAIREQIKYLLEEKAGDDAFTLSAVGHAHLDLAWLWPLREGRRKTVRTVASQLHNIDRYPDYVFGASQAQYYEWLKEESPYLFEKVKKAADTKNWDVQGSTWVENDSNLVGGESLIRQFFYGKKFFKEELGKEQEIFWVPDSFGYSACLPQVMKLAGVKYFLTQKMSWNRYNEFPYSTFRWIGLDGSEVLAHMLPEHTYNAPVTPKYGKLAYENYKEKKISNISLSSFGIGDGGAGPGYEHIERLARLNNLRGTTRYIPEKSCDFFKKLDDKNISYPSYKGELYLERHQGTYTTQSKNKRFNRKCEIALRNYEMVAVLAEEKGVDLPISFKALERLWKEILLYQFHDILPGSSIDRVYKETSPRYDAIYNQLVNGTRFLLEEMFDGDCLVNLNSFACEEWVENGGEWYKVTVPALSVVPISSGEKKKKFDVSCTYRSLENKYLKVVFENGVISSFYHKKTDKEYVKKGQFGSVISQYGDDGDAWDLGRTTASYLNTKTDARCVNFAVEKHDAFVEAVGNYEVGDCKFKQTFTLYDGEDKLHIKIDMDVHQESSMLRVAYPCDVDTMICAFNIQFGHIYRSTEESNSIELAQFEECGQKFVDMSDYENGLTLINDSKYGFRCKFGVMDIDLVRSPKHGPGTHVDQGEQTVNLVLYPHSGELGRKSYAESYQLNNPVIRLRGYGKEKCGTLYYSNNDHVILETVKRPEDGNGVLVRFYNCTEKKQNFVPQFKGMKPVEVVDLMENHISDVAEEGEFSLHKFELLTVRFVNK